MVKLGHLKIKRWTLRHRDERLAMKVIKKESREREREKVKGIRKGKEAIALMHQ